MSSLRNCVPRPAHKERSQPRQARKKFGLLEKHKDYVIRAKAYHKKQDTLKILRQKAAFKNPDEFNFKMINSKTDGGNHRPKDEVNKYSAEELMIMKTQDIGYVFQKWQSEKNKIDKLTSSLQCTEGQSSRRHVYHAEDREEARELETESRSKSDISARGIPREIKKKMDRSYRDLEGRKSRAKGLEKLYVDMSMQKELQKKGRKRKLREDEILNPNGKPVYKWRADRKR
ncbi:PREDICTED: probable U3 small nucleolar RNA-associated protein 11 isoform X1 [Camelina sativa]|uniref:U3 small nucleolar RNA-associated protein 11 n=1 Tax=Camelina sativa TaxID=90675 RepID=A0ABM0ZE37_CAMSA|nr:PREDICTED: probable U3 small nucleolar RNA-associated protein 11 isoform X1 [Camelina sativa]XP_010514467.1 PREDICTED: probable U3 small nucleolar RNA-associated protein 11 isoform X1 [Camelina sativa]XP_010514468.1 PREDICTED: probable U3 small nucleolar RNA-associated protein 11 isoform X1 [Camelina sativa]